MEDLLVAARADGLAGPPERQVGWFERVRCNAAWDARQVILVRAVGSEALVGVAHSWTGAFLKDLAIEAAYRRLGLAQALLSETAERFRSLGFTSLDLKVRPANRPARRLYATMGFRAVEV